VFARATVDGHPVALTQQRSTFFGELDSAVAFVQLMNGTVRDPASFATAMSSVTGSFNWLYVDDDDLSFFHSGLYPVRAAGVDPDLPSWGTGRWEWKGFLSEAAHPQQVNPSRGWLTSWNNKPAKAWRAADSNWGYGPVHRSEMLSDRLAARVPSGAVTRADMVRIMADAATVDLRGQEDLPVLLDLIGTPPADLSQAVGLLRTWLDRGAHRIDRDGDGEYEDQAAVALMDAWWDPLLHAVFDPILGGLYDDMPIGFDDTNRQAGTGSSFQAGFYGYLERSVQAAMGRSVPGAYSVLRCADGTKAGCRTAVLASLRDAVAALGGGSPSSWDAQEEYIEFTTLGLLSLPHIPWQNRPTFQQVVMVTGHRPG
jgi:acyl-homoserine lactone acylase PvdQ